MSTGKRDFDKEAAAWDENPGRVRMTNSIADAIISRIKLHGGMDVLDFGAGTGIITVRISPLVHTVTAVDGSRGMLDVLQSKVRSLEQTNVKTQWLDFETGETIRGSYDVVVCSMMLHHVGEISPLFDQFFNVTRDGGYICLADLDPDGGQFHGNNEGVVHFGFHRMELKNALASAGFSALSDCTAAEVVKPVDGGKRSFSIFLITGRKNPPQST